VSSKEKKLQDSNSNPDQFTMTIYQSFGGTTISQRWKARRLDFPGERSPSRGKEQRPKEGIGRGQPREHHGPKVEIAHL